MAVACTKCEWSARYSTAALIEKYGEEFAIPDLLRKLSDEDCPKRERILAYDICGVHCPDLAALLIATLDPH